MILNTYVIHIKNSFKAQASSQWRHISGYIILTANFMDTRISTQSNTILIHETNLTFKKDKSIIIFYIRNDFSSAIIGCCLGKWYFYFLYVTCHVQWNTIKENEWYLCKYYANRFLISTFFTFLWIILILITKHCKYILIFHVQTGVCFHKEIGV